MRWQKQVVIHTRLSRAYLALASLSYIVGEGNVQCSILLEFCTVFTHVQNDCSPPACVMPAGNATGMSREMRSECHGHECGLNA